MTFEFLHWAKSGRSLIHYEPLLSVSRGLELPNNALGARAKKARFFSPVFLKII